jgi:hypothetical protein
MSVDKIWHIQTLPQSVVIESSFRHKSMVYDVWGMSFMQLGYGYLVLIVADDGDKASSARRAVNAL